MLRWSAIATHLPKRTDNEIKNYWNTHLKKRLTKMGIDPVTHKPKNEALLSNDGQSKNAANLSHMAQWESARLEAEARLVRQSKLRSNSNSFGSLPGSNDFTPVSNKPVGPPTPPRCLDILKAWTGTVWTNKLGEAGGPPPASLGCDLESPTSTLSYSTTGIGDNTTGFIEFVGNSSEGIIGKEEGEGNNWKGIGNPSTQLLEFKDGMENSVSFGASHDMTMTSIEDAWNPESLGGNDGNVYSGNFMNGFTELLLNSSGDRSVSDGGDGESDSGGNGGASGGGSGSGSGSGGGGEGEVGVDGVENGVVR